MFTLRCPSIRLNLAGPRASKKHPFYAKEGVVLGAKLFDYGQILPDQFIKFPPLLSSKEWYLSRFPGLGPGELAVVFMMLGIDTIGFSPASAYEIFSRCGILGCEKRSFDIRVPPLLDTGLIKISTRQELLGAWEVKEPDANGEIRSGVGGIAAISRNYSTFINVASELRSFLCMLRSREYASMFGTMLAELRAVCGTDTNRLLAFVSDDFSLKRDRFVPASVNSIMAGNLTRGRALGDLKVDELGSVQPMAQQFGLYQVVSMLSHIRKKRPLGQSVVDDLATRYGTRCLPTNILNMLDITPLQWIVVRTLKHAAFFEPNIIIDAFINMADPASVFSNVRGLVLVRQDGFRIMSQEKFCDQSLIRFKRVGQARPRFWVQA